jgi:hypothetical protein
MMILVSTGRALAGPREQITSDQNEFCLKKYENSNLLLIAQQ